MCSSDLLSPPTTQNNSNKKQPTRHRTSFHNVTNHGMVPRRQNSRHATRRQLALTSRARRRRRLQKIRRRYYRSNIIRVARPLQNQKQRNVNLQVRQMLIKSSSEGDESLRHGDRVYLKTVLVGDDATTAAAAEIRFCYFSKKETAGRVVGMSLQLPWWSHRLRAWNFL